MNYLIETDSDDDGRNFSEPRNLRRRQYYELEDFYERFRLNRGEFENLLQRIGADITSLTARSNALCH
jgi:hypothetical protein